MELNRDTINKNTGTDPVYCDYGYHRHQLYKGTGTLAAVTYGCPFILGAAIAFVLNVPMRRIESSLSCVLKKGQPSAAPCKYGSVHPSGGRSAVSCYVRSGSPAGAYPVRPSKQYPCIFWGSPSVA